MKIIHFAGIDNLDDLKAAYKALCKANHPDLGGDVRTMQEINAEYSYLLKTGRFDIGASTVEIEENIRIIIEETIVLAGLTVELCGRWVWFTGNTFAWKDKLKALGCMFASKKKAWYWRPQDEERKGGCRPLELDKIRVLHGSQVFENKSRPCLA